MCAHPHLLASLQGSAEPVCMHAVLTGQLLNTETQPALPLAVSFMQASIASAEESLGNHLSSQSLHRCCCHALQSILGCPPRSSSQCCPRLLQSRPETGSRCRPVGAGGASRQGGRHSITFATAAYASPLAMCLALPNCTCCQPQRGSCKLHGRRHNSPPAPPTLPHIQHPPTQTTTFTSRAPESLSSPPCLAPGRPS